MPNMNGWDAAVEIRNSNKHDAKTIPIIAVTANAFDEDKSKSFAYGMNEHLAKPVEPELLYAVLNRLINA